MKIRHLAAVISLPLMLWSCNSAVSPNEVESPGGSATITAVTVTGEPGNYTFSVTITSPDTGCEQYADWWEVIGPDGRLIYRRVLAHSHVNEQPFTRSGGPVNIVANENIIVRAHMNNSGYGTEVFKGTINQGIIADTLASDVAASLALTEPLPDDCVF